MILFQVKKKTNKTLLNTYGMNYENVLLALLIYMYTFI